MRIKDLMNLQTVDLQEAIAIDINSLIQAGTLFDYNKTYIQTRFVDKNSTVGLVPNPGSHLVEEDFAGDQLWQYNYCFTIKTKKPSEAKNKLFEISQYLQLLNTHSELRGRIRSKNGSWNYIERFDVTSEPHEIQEDITGTTTYQMDVAVFVHIQI